jgi:hypothetical protein
VLRRQAQSSHPWGMGKRNKRDSVQAPFIPPTDFETERTLESAESDQPVDDFAEGDPILAMGKGKCLCGHNELLLEGYFAVIDGKLSRDPIEVEGLTCPECNREYEAVILEGGRVERGDFVGFADLEE